MASLKLHSSTIQAYRVHIFKINTEKILILECTSCYTVKSTECSIQSGSVRTTRGFFGWMLGELWEELSYLEINSVLFENYTLSNSSQSPSTVYRSSSFQVQKFWRDIKVKISNLTRDWLNDPESWSKRKKQWRTDSHCWIFTGCC